MFEVRQTEVFAKWLGGQRDRIAVAKIAMRIDRAEQGNLGDVKPVGDGVSEMRIKHGPGYRLYYTVQGQTVILLLVGGDKGTQDRDIEKAKQMVRNL